MVGPLLQLTVFLLVAACTEDHRRPEATPSPPGAEFEDTFGGSLFSSHDEKQFKKNHTLARELRRTLETLQNVRTARVHLSLEDASLLARDRKSASRAAILIVQEGEATASETEIRRFAAAAVPSLSEEQVTVIFTREPSKMSPTEKVGPFEVVEGSAFLLKTALSILLGLTALLAGGLIVAGYKLRLLAKSSKPSE